MSQVSKYPISGDVWDRIFEIFLKSLVEIKNREDADEFISDLLTPTEKIMLSKRLAIAFLLEKNYDYRTIQKIIRVSAPTISSVNILLKYGGKGYKKLVAKIIKDEKLMAFLENAVSKTLSMPAKAGKGGGVWKYLRQQVDDDRKKKRKAF